MTAHRALLTVHKWIGIAGAAFLSIVALSGAAVVFENEIDRAMNPSLYHVTPAGSPRPIADLADAARRARPGDQPVGIRLAVSPDDSVEFAMRSRLTVAVDPYSGAILGVRDREKSLARFLHRLHTELVAGPAGQKLVDWIDVVFLVLAVSGIYLWWPRKIVSVGNASSWKRTNFDLHNVVGLYASVVFLAIASSGVLIGFENTLDPVVKKLNAFDPEPRGLQSTPVAGAAPISIDRALDAARAALPGAFASNVIVPGGPKAFYRVLMKFPEDRTPAGRSRAYVDQFSGRVLFVENTRTAPAGTRILNLKRSLHTGDIFGWPTRLLYCAAALALAAQVVTGLLIWWNARAPRRRQPISRRGQRATPST